MSYLIKRKRAVVGVDCCSPEPQVVSRGYLLGDQIYRQMVFGEAMDDSGSSPTYDDSDTSVFNVDPLGDPRTDRLDTIMEARMSDMYPVSSDPNVSAVEPAVEPAADPAASAAE